MNEGPDGNGDVRRLRAELFGPPPYDNPRLAPDGRRLAWLAPVDGIAQVWVGDVADPGRGRPCTAQPWPIRFHCWAPDGGGVLHIDDATGAETWQVLHTARSGDGDRTDGTDPTDGTDTVGITTALTPDGVHADVLARSWHRPDHVLLSVERPGLGLPDVVRVDLGDLGSPRNLHQDGPSRSRDEVVAVNPGTVDAWFVDGAHRVRAATAATADGGFDLLHRTDAEIDRDAAGEWFPVLHVGPDEALTTIVVSLPGSHDVLLVTALDTDTTRLVRFDVRTGERTELGGSDDADIDGVLLHPITGEPQAYSVYGDRRRWSVLDPRIAADLAALTAPADADLRIVDRDRHDRCWLVAQEAADRPTAYALWDRATWHLTPLLHDRPPLRRRRLAPVTPFAFEARDGTPIHGYWTAPSGAATPTPTPPQPVPTVVLIHGGPWWRDLWQLDPWVQWLAALGHGCLQVGFRGSAGRGKALLNAGNRQWGGAMLDDLADAVDHAVAAGWSDPDRIVAMGRSYGGYAALMLAATGRVAGAIAHAAPSDLVSFLDAIPPEHPTMRHLWTVRLGDPDDPLDRGRLTRQSPIDRVGAIAGAGCPVLLAHGAHDSRVPIAHAHRLATALEARGAPVRLIVFDDEGHELAHPVNQQHLADEVAAHLRQIGDAAPHRTPDRAHRH